MKKFPKKSAIVSEILIIVWFVMQISLGWLPRFWSNIFGTSMYNGIYILNTGYANFIPFYMVYALMIAAIIVTASNVMIFRDKGKRAPLIISAVTTGLLPIVSELLTYFQQMSIQYSGVYYTFDTNGTSYISYVLYAAAVVSIAAGAVYACENFERVSRKTALTSQIFLIVWSVLQLLASIFKMRWLDERNIVSFMVVTLCVGNLLITASNIMIFTKKGRLAPFLISSITCGMMPIMVQIVSHIQNKALIDSIGSSLLLFDGEYFAYLSCILYVGAVLSVLAAAVYLFSKGEKTVSAENNEIHDFE